MKQMLSTLIVILLIIASLIVLFSDNVKIFDISSKKVFLKSIGNVDRTELEEVKSVIEKYTDYECIITNENLTIKSEVINASYLNQQVSRTKHYMYAKEFPIDVYISDKKLKHNNISSLGVCFGNTIFVYKNRYLKSTILHELLHNYGLDHCEEDCVMSTKPTNDWDEKNDKPIFCKHHHHQVKSKLKNY